MIPDYHTEPGLEPERHATKLLLLLMVLALAVVILYWPEKEPAPLTFQGLDAGSEGECLVYDLSTESFGWENCHEEITDAVPTPEE